MKNNTVNFYVSFQIDGHGNKYYVIKNNLSNDTSYMFTGFFDDDEMQQVPSEETACHVHQSDALNKIINRVLDNKCDKFDTKFVFSREYSMIKNHNAGSSPTIGVCFNKPLTVIQIEFFYSILKKIFGVS